MKEYIEMMKLGDIYKWETKNAYSMIIGLNEKEISFYRIGPYKRGTVAVARRKTFENNILMGYFELVYRADKTK